MRGLLLLGLSLTLNAGCHRHRVTDEPATQPRPATDQPAVHAPSGVAVGGGGGGGSGGAVQAVRKAVNRTVRENDLKQIFLFMEAASAASGRMPSTEEITEVLRKEAPPIYQQIQNKVIILTGARTREGIWAYTADTQSSAGEHLVLTVNGPERMMGNVLKQRLQEQGQ